PLLFGPKAVLHLLELPPAARFLATAALARLESGEPLGCVLAFGAQLATGDHDGSLSIGGGRRVDLAQIDRNRVRAICILWRFAILNNQVPGVAPGAAVPNQAYLQHPQDMVQVGRQWDGDRLVAVGPGEHEGIALAPD